MDSHSSQYAAPSYELIHNLPETLDDWPGHRCGHTLTAVSANNTDKLVLFGGTSTAVATDSTSLPVMSMDGVTNSVHCFDVSTRKWTRVNPTGEVPSPRAGHAAASIGNCLLIQGGMGPFGFSDGDVYMLNMASNELKWHRLIVQAGVAPCPRFGHVMGVADKRWLIIFGGGNGNEVYSDTWALDTHRISAWEMLNPYGNRPSGRMYASAGVREDGIFLLCSGRDYSDVTLGDTYALKMDSNGQWCWIRVPGVAPSPRCSHTAVFEGPRMHVFGGILNMDRLIDGDAVVAVFETQTGQWLDTNRQETSTSGRSGQSHNQLIMRRYAHAAASVGSRIYVHGGLREGVLLNDFLVADASQPSSPEIYELLDDLRVSDTSLQPSSSIDCSMERLGHAYNLPSLESAFYEIETQPPGPLQRRADPPVDENWRSYSFVPQFTESTRDLHKKVISTLLRPENWEPPASRKFFLSYFEFESLCRAAEEIFVLEPTVLQLKVPIKIFGDLHGQFGDLMRLFREYGSPSKEGDITHIDYLFLGDYVDRGQHSLETICLLLALKIEYPKNIHLIRGNHECTAVNNIHGFLGECKERMGEYNGFRAWAKMNTLFNYLPLAALIENKVLCMHGGIGRIKSIDQIARILRPAFPDSSHDMVLKDLLWSDPTENDSILGIQRNPRGAEVVSFGPDIVEEFCKNNKLDLVIRAHECVMDGFERFAEGKLFTVFSATNYCGKVNNAGAILVIGRDLVVYPKVIHPNPPPVSSSDNSSDSAWNQEQNIERPPTPARGQSTGVE